TQVGHGSGNDAVALKLVLGFEVARGGKKDVVAVHDFSGLADEKRAIRIPVESHTETRLFSDDAFLQSLEIQGATAGIDVAAIRRNAHRHNISTKRTKQFRTKLVGRAIGAIENDAKTSESGSGNKALSQESEVFRIKGFVGRERRRIFWSGFAQVLPDPRFQLFLDGIGELHACV